MSLTRQDVSKRINRRLARLNGNSTRINTLGGPPRVLGAGAGEPADGYPAWLRARRPSSGPEEGQPADQSVHRVQRAIRPSHSRDTERDLSVQPRHAMGTPSNQQGSPASPLGKTSPSGQPRTGEPQRSNSPSQSPVAQTLAVQSLTRQSTLNRIITNPIRRTIESFRKPPSLLRRSSSEEPKRLRHEDQVAAQGSESPGAARRLGDKSRLAGGDSGELDQSSNKLGPADSGVSWVDTGLARSTAPRTGATRNETDRPPLETHGPSPASSFEPLGAGGVLQRSRKLASQTAALILKNRKAPGLSAGQPPSQSPEASSPADRSIARSTAPGTGATGNGIDRSIARAAAPGAGATGNGTDRSIPQAHGPSPTSSSEPLGTGGVRQRSHKLASQTAALILKNRKAPGLSTAQGPSQSPEASSLASRSIARIADLSRVTAEPIHRAIETLRKPPVFLRRTSLGEPTQSRQEAQAATQGSEPPRVAKKLDSSSQAGGTGSLAQRSIQGDPVDSGISWVDTGVARDAASGTGLRGNDTDQSSFQAPGAAPHSPPIPGGPSGILQRGRRMASRTAGLLLRQRQTPGISSIQRPPAEIVPSTSRSLERQPAAISNAASLRPESPYGSKAPLSDPPASQIPSQRGRKLQTQATSHLTPKFETIAQRAVARTSGLSLATTTSLQRAEQILRKPDSLLRRESTEAGKGLEKASKPITAPERTVGFGEMASEAEGHRQVAELLRASPLPLAGRTSAPAAPDVPLNAVGGRELLPMLYRQGGDVRPAPAPILSRSPADGILGVIQRTRRFVSRAKDLMLRNKAETGPAEPMINHRQVSQPVRHIGPDRRESAGERLHPSEQQKSHGWIARDAAVLVYQTSEDGGQIEKSTSSPPRDQSDAKGRSFSPRQWKPIGSQNHAQLFDYAAPAASKASRKKPPALLAERSLRSTQRSAAFPQDPAGSKESPFTYAPGGQAALISRFTTGGMSQLGKTGPATNDDSQGGSLSLLDLSKPDIKVEPLPLALGRYKPAPAAGVTPKLQAPKPATSASSKQSPATGVVSRQVAAVPPQARQVGAAPAGNGSEGGPEVTRVVASPSADEQKKTFDASEIEFLASKVYSYIKQKLVIEKERHGRHGFSWWT